MKNFEVVEKISKNIDFNSRNWNKERIDKYLLKYDDKRIIESMVIVHLKDDIPRDLTIEISNMYNCVVGCIFCASGSLPESQIFLTADDYLKQVETCLEESNLDPNDYPNFYISFAGIGEPSLVKEEIAKGINLIKEKYNNIQVNIATTGFDSSCFNYWNKMNLPIRTLQLSCYAFDLEKIKYIIKNIPKNYNLFDNIKNAIKYKNNHNICRVKINYVVLKDLNDSDEDINNMINYLSKYKNDIIIKISFLNYTKKCKENNLISPNKEDMLKIKNILIDNGFKCYLFGTENNTELGCGQLVQNHISDE